MGDIKKAQAGLERKGYSVKTFATKEEAAAYLNGAIDATTVGIGGSMTVKEMGLYDLLSAHNEVHWHWVGGPGERDIAKDAKIYLTSANGLAETGEIINIDGVGNRVASTLYGHDKVYYIIGRNKIAPTYDEALWRARNVAAPLNARRLNKKTPCAVGECRCYDCNSPEKVCRAMVVMLAPLHDMPLEIVLIDEDLGM